MTKGANITLVRGRTYSVVHPSDRRKGAMTFERAKKTFVSDEEIILFCEETYEVITDSDEEEVEKPLFLVERGNFQEQPASGPSRRRVAVNEPRSRRIPRKV